MYTEKVTYATNRALRVNIYIFMCTQGSPAYSCTANHKRHYSTLLEHKELSRAEAHQRKSRGECGQMSLGLPAHHAPEGRRLTPKQRISRSRIFPVTLWPIKHIKESKHKRTHDLIIIRQNRTPKDPRSLRISVCHPNLAQLLDTPPTCYLSLRFELHFCWSQPLPHDYYRSTTTLPFSYQQLPVSVTAASHPPIAVIGYPIVTGVSQATRRFDLLPFAAFSQDSMRLVVRHPRALD